MSCRQADEFLLPRESACEREGAGESRRTRDGEALGLLGRQPAGRGRLFSYDLIANLSCEIQKGRGATLYEDFILLERSSAEVDVLFARNGLGLCVDKGVKHLIAWGK